MKEKIKLKNKIELLKNASRYKLTEDTIRNIAKTILLELIELEEYEMCISIQKLENKLLDKLKADRNKLVKNVGFKKGELDKLLKLS